MTTTSPKSRSIESCAQARDAIRLLPDESPQPGLKDHLLRCPACHDYRKSLRASAAALGRLKGDSESDGSDGTADRTYDSRPSSLWPEIERAIRQGRTGPEQTNRSRKGGGTFLLTIAASLLLAVGFTVVPNWTAPGTTFGRGVIATGESAASEPATDETAVSDGSIEEGRDENGVKDNAED